ncbi:MAG: hypothetical protein H0U74_20205 [Bradymonadaceae bacterium]|nr:hypothetical protein [Lujinxingiaceae bacterium]
MLTLSACNKKPAARLIAFPIIETANAFPELRAGSRSNKGGADGAHSSFERAISRALESEPETEEAATVTFQTIPLGAGLVGVVPLNFDEWRWASDGNTTMITHSAAGQSPDALIYIEGFGPIIKAFPSVEMTRFQKNVDSGAPQGPNILSTLAGGLSVASENFDVPALALLESLESATSATFGLGIGYHSNARSFTGWRWLGKNAQGITLRLGRNSGVWGPQKAPDAQSRQAFGALSELIPELSQIGDQFAAFGQAGSAAPSVRVPRRLAYMVFGSAASRVDGDQGVHLAILCEQPGCPVAHELADFLASIRRADSDQGRLGASPSSSLPAFAQGIGINLAPAESLVSPDKLESLFNQLSF